MTSVITDTATINSRRVNARLLPARVRVLSFLLIIDL